MENEQPKKLVDYHYRVPGWLIGMPDDWWELYFDRVSGFAVSNRWGHA